MGKAAYGAILSYEDSPGSSTYTKVDGVYNITGPNQTGESVDITDHDSPGGFREYEPTLLDAGELTVSFNSEMDNTSQIFVNTTWEGRANIEWTLQSTDTGTTTVTFNGHITAFNRGDHDVAGKVDGSFTIKITGKPTYA